MTGPEEERIRALVAEAHRADAPPPFDEVMRRALRPRPRRFARLALAPLAAAALAAGLFLLWPRPAPPPAPAPGIAWSDPLGFLLEPPGGDLMKAVPHFDTDGASP